MSIPFSGEPFSPSRNQPSRAAHDVSSERQPAGDQRQRSPGTPTGLRGSRGSAGDHFDADGFFGRQKTPTELLPPPEPLLENLTRCVMEVLRGARDIDQLGRWISEDVYKHLLKRQLISARARQIKGTPATRPVLVIGRISTSSPADGVIEAVVMVYEKPRARAVAIRLEGVDRRWRATSIGIL
ncbi:Rv3235 family protein [Mycetocola zhujimingii]|uniref:Rv3235 family protein n=2 Tax=Mycetocola zhujimingii TaxID=2079792 RepID=UPI001E3CF193|nr:Rv3235 family protein [Mycetocola zhujimingii]